MRRLGASTSLFGHFDLFLHTVCIPYGLLILFLPHTDAFVPYSPLPRALRNEGFFNHDGSGPWVSPQTQESHGTPFNLTRVVSRWHAPEMDAHTTDGVAGGITWALHPDFCERVLPQFRSERFVFGLVATLDCNALRASVALAMSTWSANHRSLSFHDVSDACTEDRTLMSEDGTRCSAAEVLVRAENMQRSGGAFTVAYIITHVHEAMRSPVLTSGIVVPGGVGILSAEMAIDVDTCWYQDALFCSFFHTVVGATELQESVRIVLLLLLLIAIVGLGWEVMRANARALGETSTCLCVGKRRVRRASMLDRQERQEDIAADAEFGERRLSRVTRMSVVGHWSRKSNGDANESVPSSTEGCVRSMFTRRVRREWGNTIIQLPMTSTLIFVFIIAFLPVFYTDVYLPCYDCHDFEAVIAHEVGHLLGFHHPDEMPALNLRRRGRRYGTDGSEGTNEQERGLPPAVHCEDPLYADVELARHPDGYDTIMKATAAHRPRTCLTQDDFDGLHTLYPSCIPLAVTTPSCVETVQYTGVLRLLIAVMIPFTASVLFLIVVQYTARYIHRERVANLENRLVRSSVQGFMLRASCAHARVVAQMAEGRMAEMALSRTKTKRYGDGGSTTRRSRWCTGWKSSRPSRPSNRNGISKAPERAHTEDPAPLKRVNTARWLATTLFSSNVHEQRTRSRSRPNRRGSGGGDEGIREDRGRRHGKHPSASSSQPPPCAPPPPPPPLHIPGVRQLENNDDVEHRRKGGRVAYDTRKNSTTNSSTNHSASKAQGMHRAPHVGSSVPPLILPTTCVACRASDAKMRTDNPTRSVKADSSAVGASVETVFATATACRPLPERSIVAGRSLAGRSLAGRSLAGEDAFLGNGMQRGRAGQVGDFHNRAVGRGKGEMRKHDRTHCRSGGDEGTNASNASNDKTFGSNGCSTGGVRKDKPPSLRGARGRASLDGSVVV
jgi:hypothetical protein